MAEIEPRGAEANRVERGEDFLLAATTVIEKFRKLLVDDTAFRHGLRTLARGVLKLTDVCGGDAGQSQNGEQIAVSLAAVTPSSIAAVTPLSGAIPPVAGTIAPSSGATTPTVAHERPLEAKLKGVAEKPPAPPRSSEPLPPLTLGQPGHHVEHEPVRKLYRGGPTTVEDLPLIEQRSRLKSEGARWTAKRRQLLDTNADFQIEIAPMDRDLIRRAKEIEECFLWMNYPQWQPPADLSLLEDVAGCFDALADAVALVRVIEADSEIDEESFDRALDLLAEAQSAVRVATGKVNFSNDTEQMKTFSWLRSTAADRQIMIQRFMRLDDPADPTKWQDLSARIAAIDAQIQTGRRAEKERRKLFNKARYLVEQLTKGQGDVKYNWDTLVQAIEGLIAGGVPASNRELRDILLPVVDDAPNFDDIPPGLEQVLAEIDRYLSTRPPAEEAKAEQQPSAEVVAAAKLLKGRGAVLIGGDRRADAHEKLVRAFQLSDLEWIPTRAHESVSKFEAAVARPEVAVVLLAIRWASHSYGDVIKFCEETGKPLVRLPAGYNPNQVAAQIMSQCGSRLKGVGV